MNSPEWVLSQKVLTALTGLNAISIEVKNHKGVPDISYAGGWIELKHLNHIDEIGKLNKSFTEQQRHWLKTRWGLGEACWLLIQIEKSNQWFLFSGKKAQDFSEIYREDEERRLYSTKIEEFFFWDLHDMCGSMDNLERLSKFLSNYKREPGSIQECCETLMKLTEKEVDGELGLREKDPGHGWKVIAEAAKTLEGFCPELIHAIVKFPSHEGYWDCELPKNHKPHLY